VVTKRQLNALERKLNLKLSSNQVFVFDEIKGILFDQEGQEISKSRLKQLEQSDNVIIIDDV
jgi:hypothetical protein